METPRPKRFTSLEDLKKDRVFTTPDDYFDKLPGRIHNRIKKPDSIVSWSVVTGSLKYAIPAVLLFVAVIWFTHEPGIGNPEDLIAQASQTEILDYLEEAEFTSTEIASFIEAPSEVYDQILEEEFLDGISEEELLLEDWDAIDMINEEVI